MAVELNPVGGICGEHNVAGLGAETRDHVTNGAAALELRDHQIAIGGIFPNPQFMNGAPDEFGTGISITELKGGVYVHKTPFVDSGDRKWQRARPEDFVEFLFGQPPVALCQLESPLGGIDIVEAFFKFRSINGSPFVK